MANSDYTVRTGSNGFCPVGYLTANIGPLDSAVTMSGYTSPIANGIRIGMAAMIGDEIVVVTARTGNNLTLGRGCCDTVPAPHSTGDAIWFFDDSIGSDRMEYAGTETIGVKPLPRVTTGTLPIEHSPPAELTFNLRFARPYPPGLVEVNGDPWFTTPLVLSLAVPTLEVTWAHRDRITQQDQLIDHLEADIGPEAGTTYELRVYRADGTLLRTEAGITGTSWSYGLADAIADFSAAGDEYLGYITLRSMRDGLSSFQQYRIDFTLQSSTVPEVDDACGVILLNFEDGLTDSSHYARTITGYNGAAASTTRAKWGTHAITTDGTYRLQTPDAPELRLGNLEWAFEGWLYVPSSVTFGTVNCIACKWTTTGGTQLTIFWGIDIFGRLTVGFSDDGTTLSGGTFLVASAGAVPRDVFFHAALWRTKASSLDSTYGAINGVSHQIASTSIGSLHDNAAPICILDTDYAPNPMPSGCTLDGFRMMVGSCPFPRGDFTPPTGPYVCVAPPEIPDTTDVTLTLTASLPEQPAGASIAMNLTQPATPVSAGSAYVSIFYIPTTLQPDPVPAGRTISVSFGMGLSQAIAVETVLSYTTTASTSQTDIMDALIAQANASSALSSRGLTAGANAYTGRPGMQINGPVGLKLHSTYGVMTPGLLAPIFSPVNNMLAVEFALGSPIVTVALNQIVTATLSGTPAAGDRFTITLNGVPFGYTAASGASLSDIATALAALIDADSNYAAAAVGAVITIDGVTSTNVFSYAASSVSLFAY